MLHEPTGCEPFDDSICEIPVYRYGAVVAHARVDPGDWFAMSPYRWTLHKGGYAIGYMSTGRYRRHGLRGKRVGDTPPLTLMHRAIVGLQKGDRRQVDHINRDRLDNRRANLRIVTSAQQRQNQGGRPNRSSAYRGVSWDASVRKWRATASLNGRYFALGRFVDEDEAAAAVVAFRAEHMPFSEEATRRSA